MRLSARKAWHDAFYIPKDDALARARTPKKNVQEKAPKEPGQVYSQGWYRNLYEEAEKGRVLSGRKPLVTGSESAKGGSDFFERWDAMWRSRIQAAIKTLPKPLRSFGAIMYAPATEFSAEDCERVHEYLQNEFFKALDKDRLLAMQGKRIVRLKLLMYAAMRHHRDVVFGGGSTLGGPAGISRFLYHMYGERLPSVQNWAEHWAADWDKMLGILDNMERKALAPVANEIGLMSEEREGVA